MIVHGRISHSSSLEEILLFQDVWIQQILITISYYNNFNTVFTYRIDVLYNNTVRSLNIDTPRRWQ